MKWSKNYFSLYSTRSNDLFDCLWKNQEDASGKVEIEFLIKKEMTQTIQEIAKDFEAKP